MPNFSVAQMRIGKTASPPLGPPSLDDVISQSELTTELLTNQYSNLHAAQPLFPFPSWFWPLRFCKQDPDPGTMTRQKFPNRASQVGTDKNLKKLGFECKRTSE